MTTNLDSSVDVSGRARRSFGVLAGVSLAQAVAAGGAAVLAIIGLSGTLTGYMIGIATIALGAAFLMQGGSLASQSLRFASDVTADYGSPPVASVTSAASIAGIAGVALGILALLEVAPLVLIPVSIIAFAGGLFLDGAATEDRQHAIGNVERLTGASFTGGGGNLLVGIAGAVLGILALIGFAPVTLSLVGLLTLGVAAFLNSSAAGAMLARLAR